MLDLVTMNVLRIRRTNKCCDRIMVIKKSIVKRNISNTITFNCIVCNKKNIVVRVFEKIKKQRRKLEWERRRKNPLK